jgi:hydroxymethylpyrimidine pyrophosphatase-like HAD family hydrolase
LATDLDGTFWGPDLVAPPEHVAAAEELMHKGVTVLVATSRRPRVTGKRLAEAGLVVPAVLVDGAVGIDFRTGERFHEAVFEVAAAGEILTAFRAHRLDPCLYVDDPDIDVVVSSAPSTCAAHLAYLGPVAATEELDHVVLTKAIYAFSVLGLDRESLGPLAAELVGECGATAVLYPEPIYGGFGLTVNPRGVSKWSGIEAYCTLHGISREQVAAVGDGPNDIEMLSHASLRIGVRGGCDEVVEMADCLIDAPDRKGWTEILGHLGSSL